MKTLVFIASALFAILADARALPGSVTMRYTLSQGGTTLGNGTENYRSDGKNYSIVSEAQGEGIYRLLFGNIKRVSRGIVEGDGLKPNLFEDVRNDKTYAKAGFDWDAMQLRLEYKDRKKTVALAPDAQDQLSFAYSFAFDEQLPSELDVQLTNGKRLSSYHYINLGRETLTTPLGRIETIHLKREAEPGKSGSEFWLSPAHRNLPVKVVIIDDDDGSRFEQIVTAIEFE